MNRVAIFGGSFDPPQVCHVLVATYVVCQTDIDELRLMPVFKHPFGKALAPFGLRVSMLEASIRHLGPKARVDRLESELPHPNYTIDTVEAILDREPETALTLVCGTDVFEERAQWKDWERLESLVDFMVFGREGCVDPPGIKIEDRLPGISSSDVRSRIERGAAVDHLVPGEALELIRDHQLYGV